jgi:putative ABC transport system permease protein
MLKSIDKGIKVEMERLGADLLVAPKGYEAKASTVLLSGEPQLFYMDESVVDKIATMEGVAVASPQTFMETSSYLLCCEILETLLIGFDPETDFTITPWVESKVEGPLNYERDVITGGMAPVYEGYSYYIYGQEFRVYARLQKTGLDYFDRTIFIPRTTAYKLAQRTKERKGVAPLKLNPGEISIVLVKVSPNINLTRLVNQIKEEIPDVSVLQMQEMFANTKQMFLKLFGGLFILAAVLWIANTLMISAIFSTIVSERQRELGILRAIGANRGAVFKLIILESVVLTSIGGIIGIVAGSIIFAIFKSHIVSSFTVLKFPYIWPSALEMLAISAGSILAALGMGVMGAIYPALSSTKLEPYYAIRTGE